MSFDELLRLGAAALTDPDTGGEWATYLDLGVHPGRRIPVAVSRAEPQSDPALSSAVRFRRAMVLVRNHPTDGTVAPNTRDRMVLPLRAGADPVEVRVLGILSGDAGAWELEVGA